MVPGYLEPDEDDEDDSILPASITYGFRWPWSPSWSWHSPGLDGQKEAAVNARRLVLSEWNGMAISVWISYFTIILLLTLAGWFVYTRTKYHCGITYSFVAGLWWFVERVLGFPVIAEFLHFMATSGVDKMRKPSKRVVYLIGVLLVACSPSCGGIPNYSPATFDYINGNLDYLSFCVYAVLSIEGRWPVPIREGRVK